MAYRRHSRTLQAFRRFIQANKKQLAVLTAVLAVIIGAAAVISYITTQQKYENSFLVTNDVIRIGIRVGVPGFGEETEDGEIAGFDRDYMDAVLARMLGDEPKIYEYVPLTSQDAGAAVKYGAADICLGQLSSGLLQTTGFTLTNPYFTDRVVALVAPSSQLASLREISQEVGILHTALSADTVKDQLEELGYTTDLVNYADYESALTDLTYGRIPAVLMPYETARQFTQDGYRILTEELFPVSYRILLPSGQTAVAQEMNAVISQLAEDGTTEALRRKWNI